MKTSFGNLTAAIVAILASASVGSAAAAPTLWYFGGIVTEAIGTPVPAAGSSFFGSLAYDPAAAQVGSGPNWADYALPSGALTLDVHGGHATSATGGLGVATGFGAFVGGHIDDRHVVDELQFGGLLAGNTGTMAGFDGLQLYQWLESESTALDLLALPASPFSLDTPALLETVLVAYDYDSPLHYLSGTITCLATDATACSSGGGSGGGSVPEPGALLLVGLGLAGLARHRLQCPCRMRSSRGRGI
jgi:MYXO-CTERM domain-containing protein